MPPERCIFYGWGGSSPQGQWPSGVICIWTHSHSHPWLRRTPLGLLTHLLFSELVTLYLHLQVENYIPTLLVSPVVQMTVATTTDTMWIGSCHPASRVNLLIWHIFWCRFADRDMLMHYHWGLGVGHLYSHQDNEANLTAPSAPVISDSALSAAS